jgi:hypothetical protein
LPVIANNKAINHNQTESLMKPTVKLIHHCRLLLEIGCGDLDLLFSFEPDLYTKWMLQMHLPFTWWQTCIDLTAFKEHFGTSLLADILPDETPVRTG